MNTLARASSVIRRPEAWAMLAILVLSLTLNLWNVGFPFGYHIDEPRKTMFVLEGNVDFKHPLLMRQVARAGNVLVDARTNQEAVVLGRSVVAVFGTLAVLFSFLIARKMMRPLPALLAALSVAVAPTLVVHAHYFKEDTPLLATLLAAFLALAVFAAGPTLRRAVVLGLACGLSSATHYKAALLIPLVAIAFLLGEPGSVTSADSRRIWRRTFIRHLPVSVAVAAAVFLVVNWPLIANWQLFRDGVAFEAEHALTGHDIQVRPLDAWFTFHVRHSLGPGMGWPAAIVGLACLVWTLVRWNRADWVVRLSIVFAVLFYLIPEVSPLKPPPDYSRYMLPVVPILIVLIWRAVSVAAARMPPAVHRAAAVTIAAAVIAYPLYLTVRLTASMADDTRARAVAWLEQQPEKFIAERYTGLPSDVEMAAEVDLDQARRDGIRYVVASSFMYDRYSLPEATPYEEGDMYQLRDSYVALFRHPYVEIAPAFRSFGFTNPVIRIVDITRPR